MAKAYHVGSVETERVEHADQVGGGVRHGERNRGAQPDLGQAFFRR